MADAAYDEFLATVLICGSFVDVYYVLRRLAGKLHVDIDEKAACVQHWMGFLVASVRDNSFLTLGHSQQHSYTMPWGECRHCITRAFGPPEFEALEEAVMRMLWLAR